MNMEIKVTFRFDASDSLLTCVNNFRKAMEAMAAAGGFSVLPMSKDVGIVKAVATEDGVTVNKKERIWPPVDGGAAPASPGAPVEPTGSPSSASGEAGGASVRPSSEPPTVVMETVPTVADMREAVNQLRARIEGADWEDKTSEGYKRWHKKVTAAVKGIVTFCGADKIPGIPEENRASFITQVNSLSVVGDEVKSEAPF